MAPCVNPQSGPLVIRYSGSDTGTRPLPDAAAHWASPDIWLDHPSDTIHDEATAAVNVVQTIKVLVRNIGAQPIDGVSVEAYICDYTAGVSPSSAIPGTGKFTGFTPTIANGASTLVSCTPTWTPTVAQLAINGGHICMFANCFSDTDGQSVDSIDFSTTNKPPIFRCDSHLAQRNIRIVAASKGAGLKSIPIDFFVANPSQEFVLNATLNVHRLTGALALGKSERWMLETSHLVNTISLNGRKRFVLADQGGVIFRNRAAAARKQFGTDDLFVLKPSRFRKFDYMFEGDGFRGGRDVKLELPPRERVRTTAMLQLQGDEQVGSMHTFDISQQADDGTVIGGVRVLMIITP